MQLHPAGRYVFPHSIPHDKVAHDAHNSITDAIPVNEIAHSFPDIVPHAIPDRE